MDSKMKVKTSSIAPAGSLAAVVLGTIEPVGKLGWGISFSDTSPPMVVLVTSMKQICYETYRVFSSNDPGLVVKLAQWLNHKAR